MLNSMKFVFTVISRIDSFIRWEPIWKVSESECNVTETKTWIESGVTGELTDQSEKNKYMLLDLNRETYGSSVAVGGGGVAEVFGCFNWKTSR